MLLIYSSYNENELCAESGEFNPMHCLRGWIPEQIDPFRYNSNSLWITLEQIVHKPTTSGRGLSAEKKLTSSKNGNSQTSIFAEFECEDFAGFNSIPLRVLDMREFSMNFVNGSRVNDSSASLSEKGCGVRMIKIKSYFGR